MGSLNLKSFSLPKINQEELVPNLPLKVLTLLNPLIKRRIKPITFPGKTGIKLNGKNQLRRLLKKFNKILERSS